MSTSTLAQPGPALVVARTDLAAAGETAGSLVPWAMLLLLALGIAGLVWIARRAARRGVRRALSSLRELSGTARSVAIGDLGTRFRAPTTEAEVQELVEELNAALERLEDGYRAQAQFAQNVAHELKSPLAALLTDAQVSRLGRRDPAKLLAFVGRAEEELKHLGELVESFLCMARVDAATDRRELVHVDDVVRRAAWRCQAEADRGGVPVTLELSPVDARHPFVRGDAQLLQAMVENLIRNAIHHSAGGAEVGVEITHLADEVRITVRDRGPGIPEELRQVVLERGVRSLGRVRASGTGRGLAIVDSVARLQGGHVTVEPNPGGGSAFVITLPIAGSAAG